MAPYALGAGLATMSPTFGGPTNQHRSTQLDSHNLSPRHTFGDDVNLSESPSVVPSLSSVSMPDLSSFRARNSRHTLQNKINDNNHEVKSIDCKWIKSTYLASTSDDICTGSPISSQVEIKDRMTAALWSMFAADALAMPVHWYYNRELMKQQYGCITDYTAPQRFHPDSFLHVCNPDGNNTDANTYGKVVGSMILHDKRHLWSVPGMHYHQSLSTGENTLNAQCARLLMQTISETGTYDSSDFLENYVDFMVTPGSHNDTYAESFHRDFFKNFSNGKNVFESAGEETPDTATAGALVMVPIIAFTYFDDRDLAKKMAVGHVRLTHKSAELERAVELYVDALLRILHGERITDVCDQACLQYTGFSLKPLWKSGLSEEKVMDTIGIMCHVSASLPAIFYLAGAHSECLEAGLLMNANMGGSSCHRGTALGALLGAGLGTRSVPRRFVNGLKDRDTIAQEISRFVDAIMTSRTQSLHS